MVFDTRDFGVLRLCGLCRYIPVRLQRKFQTPIFEPKVFVTLRNHKLIKLQTNLRSYKLTQDGREILAEMGFSYPEDSRTTIKKDSYYRRLRASLFNITLYLAGIDVFYDDIRLLAEIDKGFVSSLLLRRENDNKVISGTRFLGILKSGSTAYIPYYIQNRDEWIYPGFEREIFMSQISAMRNIKNVEIILAGRNLQELLNGVLTKHQSKPEPNGLKRFDIALEELGCDYLFLPLNDLGVMQMKVTMTSRYRERVIDALGCEPVTVPTLAECDGMIGETPYVVGFDFNVRKILRAIRQVERYDPNLELKICCFSFQEAALEFLLNRFEVKHSIIVTIKDKAIRGIFPELFKKENLIQMYQGKEGIGVDASERHIRKDDVEISEDYEDIL